MTISFVYEQKILGFSFLLISIFILSAKGAVKSIEFTKLKVNFYNLPELEKLITKSSEWLEANLNINEISVEQIPQYMELTLSRTLTMTSPFRNKKINVSNLKNFRKYSRRGYYGFTTPEVALENWYGSLLLFFEMLEKSSLSYKKSNKNFDYIMPKLPATILPTPFFNDEYVKDMEDVSVGNFIKNKKCKIKSGNSNYTIYGSLDKKFDDFHYFVEIMRADFCNSGCEEIFILGYYHIGGGTLNFYYPLLVRHINGKFDVVELNNKMCLIESIINTLFRLKLILPIKLKLIKLIIKDFFRTKKDSF